MKMPRILKILFFMILVLLYQTELFAEEANIRTLKALSGVPENGKVEEFLKQIYTEAFRRLGISIVYRYYPFRRSALMLDKELVDVDLARQYSFWDLHPNLIRVEESGYTDSYAAFAINPSIQMNGWNSLLTPNLRIDYLRGHTRIEDQIEGMDLENKLLPLAKDVQGLDRLIAGRSDVYLSSELFVKVLLATDQYNNSGIRMVGILERVDLYAYMLGNYQDIALSLSDVLKDMKKEGLIDQYISSAIH